MILKSEVNHMRINPWIPSLRTLMALDALLSAALCLALIKPPIIAIPVSLLLAGLTAAAWLFFSFYPKTQFPFGRVFFRGFGPARSVVLTFDDGPHPEFTNRLLDVLKEEKVKATFFVTGKNAQAYPETLNRIHTEGHSIGNHGWSHRYMAFLPNKEIIQEIDKTQKVIAKITGQVPKLFRPPYGNRDFRVLAMARKSALETISWSVTSWDWRCPGADLLFTRVWRQIEPGAVLLFHDGACNAAQTDRSQTVEAVKQLISKLKDNGYRLSTVEAML